MYFKVYLKGFEMIGHCHQLEMKYLNVDNITCYNLNILVSETTSVTDTASTESATEDTTIGMTE